MIQEDIPLAKSSVLYGTKCLYRLDSGAKVHALCSTSIVLFCTVHLILNYHSYCAQGVKCAVQYRTRAQYRSQGGNWEVLVAGEGFTSYDTARAGEEQSKTWEGMLTLWDERAHHVVVHATIVHPAPGPKSR